MAQYTITGEDTFIINDRVITDFIDGDISTITYNEDLYTSRTGKNGNTIHSYNEAGVNADCVIRLLKGSSDDQYFRGLVATAMRDKVGIQLLNGSLVKRLGDGAGNIISEVANLQGGVIRKIAPTKSNANGDIEQAVSVYEIKFPTAKIGFE